MESPDHYTRGSIETWDYIRDQGLNYHLGNAIKYISRAGFKSTTTKTEDIKKAIHYLENELQHTPTISVPPRASYGVPYPLWDYEFEGEPDYATGFDR